MELDELPSGACCSRSDAFDAARTLAGSWKMHPSDNAESRIAVIVAARERISSVQADAETLLLYADMASQACIWCTELVGAPVSSSVNKAMMETFGLVASVFNSMSKLLPTCHVEPVSTLMRLYFKFLKAAYISHEGSRELHLAWCQSTKLAGALAIDYCGSLPIPSVQDLVISVTKFLIETASEVKEPGLLNVSWRAAVFLLEAEAVRDIAKQRIKVSDAIVALLSLARDTLNQGVRLTIDSKAGTDRSQQFAMPKFFLTHAYRLSRVYSSEAMAVLDDMVASAASISAVPLALHGDQPTSATVAVAICDTVCPIALALLVEPGFISNVNFISCVISQDAVGAVSVFIYLLEISSRFCKQTLLELGRGLDWLLDVTSRMPIYSMLFQKKILPSTGSDSCCKLFYLSILQALEVYVLAAAQDSETWSLVEEFLFQNVLHPYPVCRQLVVDLWCFIAKNSTEQLSKNHLQCLLALLQDLSGAAFELLGRVACSLLKAATGSVLPWLTTSIFRKDTFSTNSSARIATVLLQGGFPIDKTTASQFIDVCLNSVARNGVSRATDELPFSCLLELSSRCLDEDASKIASLAIDMIGKQGVTARMLSKALQLLAALRERLDLPVETVLVNLKSTLLKFNNDGGFKLSLAAFLATLYDVPVPEGEATCSGHPMWDLYHFLLKERHWSLVHSALTSFGEFAAKTSCNELWRFVPSDAALAFDASGTTTTDEGFMDTFRGFLERDCAKTELEVSDAELACMNAESNGQKTSAELEPLAKIFSQSAEQEPLAKIASQQHQSAEQQHQARIVSRQQQGHVLSDGLAKLLEGVALLKEITQFEEEERKLIATQMPMLISELLAFQDASARASC